MTTAPSIILTRLDVQRLEKFIADQNEDTPGIQALQAELDRADRWLATMKCLRAL